GRQHGGAGRIATALTTHHAATRRPSALTGHEAAGQTDRLTAHHLHASQRKVACHPEGGTTEGSATGGEPRSRGFFATLRMTIAPEKYGDAFSQPRGTVRGGCGTLCKLACSAVAFFLRRDGTDALRSPLASGGR